MKYFTYVFSLLLISVSSPAIAQKSEHNELAKMAYFKAVDFYKNEAFKAANQHFEKAFHTMDVNSEYREDCNYYYALTAIKLNEKGGDALMTQFVQNYPTSNRKNEAYLEVGNHYYANGKPAASLKWFQKASPKFMTNKQEADYNFKMGYALFSNKKYTEAKQYLLPLTRSEIYADEANYYYGYIAYLQEDYSTAQEYFKKIENNARYKNDLAYYLMNINFKQKKYTQVVETGEDLLKIVSRRQISEISKIVGESYFYLNDFKKAIPHLKNYKGKKNRLSTNDHYFLGNAYYKENDFPNAVLTFSRIAKGKDAVAQNAYYHLADSYLKMDKKSEALNAFKNCSELNYDQDIKEDAWYNYAKLSYDIGNPYKNTSEVLMSYIQQYPNNAKAREINKLIVQSFISSKDYKGALAYYQKRHLSKDSNYQKTSLYRGIQLFQNSDYQEALAHFKTSSNQVFDKKVQARALYWQAETYYRMYNFKQALLDFKRFSTNAYAKNTEEYKNSNYSIGYSYFKLKDYDRAKGYFENFIKTKPKDKVKFYDSYVRLGDCHFIGKSYWNAMTAYNKVIEANAIDADYAQYQKAISYGFVSRNTKKIETLKPFSKNHPKSTYKDDALFELGNAYIRERQSSNAISTFQKLIDTHKKSVYIPNALLKQGLIYYNENNPDKSIAKYKSIVSTYPKSKEASQAVKNARQVYVDIDKVDEYAEWIRSINYTSVSDIDLDNTMYEAAEKKFLANNLTQAISSFKKYLINFPEGIHALKANFYSAQAYFSTKNTEKAAEQYQFVISQNASEFTEQALSRLAQIYLEKNNWEQAIPILKRLELEANFPQNIVFAQSNLMKGMYEKQDFENTVLYAEKVLENKKVEDQVKSDAYIFIARSAIKTAQLEKAKTAYEEVSKIAKGALKAEALYYDAYFKNLDKDYEASNKTVQILAADYASHKYWGVKGLLLMAKNNDGLKDAFQATFILENIIKNYGQFEDLKLEAQTILEEITKRNTTKTENESTDF
ncbi:tetratricopeptide repeat protein [Flavicella sediminum]|uniref:tetratricopeptide repeat protein n=1 Tax=Flavicella sediminum TaxID=2585141 RepID=UPI001124662B|nr:tetratricopeptide repeat protein [Flavicella sediminum]